jgi:beta-glucuronidase
MLYPIQSNQRNRLDISGIWDFQIDPNGVGESEGWFHRLPAVRPMAVPGSWNEQYEDLFDYFGLSWYVTRTYVPQSWRGQRIFIRVGSANYLGTVYVNGKEIGSHEGGHLPFVFEITDLVIWDQENIIAISVENHLRPTRVPSAGMEAASLIRGYPSTTFDFYPFAGLHRPVVLYSVPQTHIEDITVVTGIDSAAGTVKVTVTINTERAKGRVILVGEDQTLDASLQFENGVAETTVVVPSAHLWSDTDPYLYELTVVTDSDRYSLKVGIRTVEVRGKQILLNGEPVQLNGYGRHEDFYASGKGLNLPLMVKDYQLMRWTGANSYRTSHYPYSEEEMMLADREGFLIIDETPAVSLQFDNEENVAERYRMCLRQIDELLARDKNHPSVVMWSVANEPMPPNMMARLTGQVTEEDPLSKAGKDFLTNLLCQARRLDPSRPVTFAGVMGSPVDWQEECDVVCVNRYWGWYVHGGELQKGFDMLVQELDAIWETLGMPIIVTEFGADTQPGLHGHPSVMWTEEYQAAFIRGYLEVAARKDFVAGMQVWNFADFAAVQSVMRVGGMNMKGVFTRARQPKMAAHVLREFWTKAPQPRAQVMPAGEAERTLPMIDGDDEIPAALAGLAQLLERRKPDLTTVLQFDFGVDGVYRLVAEKGVCRVESGEGEAVATMRLTWDDAQQLFAGRLNPMVAIIAGKIKTEGDARAFLVLQDLT